MYGLRLRRRKRLRQLLDWVELTDDRGKRVREASGGMQRRLALAAAFVHDPAIAFLDEPTAGIDPILRARFWDQFRTLRESGRTLIVTTQYVGEAANCDVVGVLSAGELVFLGTPTELLANAGVTDGDFDAAFVALIERHRGGGAPVSSRPPRLRASRPWARVIQASAFVRKELVEIARQPRLLALLVVGPFALLLLFGAGYRNDDLRMRTMFVGPAGSFYEDAVADHQDELERFVRPEGFTDDLDAARARLADGDVDAVVVFPADPLDTVLAGEHAEIEVIHDKIDPIQQTAIEVAARLAVQEVNAQVVTAVVGLRAGRAATGRRGRGRVDRGRVGRRGGGCGGRCDHGRRGGRDGVRRCRRAARPRRLVGPRARAPRRRRRRHPP